MMSIIQILKYFWSRDAARPRAEIQLLLEAYCLYMTVFSPLEMDAQGQDFEMPSPKRQRTESPIEARPAAAEDLDSSHAPVVSQARTGGLVEGTPAMADEKTQSEVAEGSDMLDVLMQHVESEAGSKAAEANPQAGVEQTPAIEDAQQAQDVNMEDTAASVQTAPAPGIEYEPSGTEQAALAQPAGSANDSQHDPSFPPGLEATEKPTLDHLQEVAKANDLPPTADTLAQNTVPPATAGATDAQVAPEAREWETDSSPYDSSDSSDTSSDSSSGDDSSEEDGEEYTLLDPYEQARILMAEDGGGGGGGGGGAHSDDEGTSRPARGNAGAGLRTTNEKTDEILPKPDVTVTENMLIELLGTVEATIETTVLVKAATSGSYQVLESGSVLCLADRSVIGAVHETLGRVEQPLYTVRFASDTDVRESGVSEKGTKIYFVKDHSSFVFTQPLKAVKGSDASNFHDEEVGDEEMEFSDDEAEAEHKRQMKLRRKGIDPSTVPAPGRGGRGREQRGGRGSPSGRGGNYMSSIPESDTTSAYGNGSLEMNYDDVEEGETEYTPLRRPETLPLSLPNSSGMNTSAQMSPQTQSSYTPQNQNQNTRGSHQTQNRGGRGRGGGSHNNNRGRGRGRGRGGNNYHNNNNSGTYNTNNNAFPTSMYTQPSHSQTPHPQQQQQYYPSLPQQPQQQQQPYFTFTAPPPPPPQLTPYNTSSNTTTIVPPSPMTPLAGPGAPFQAQAPTQYHNQNQNQNQNQMPWQQYHLNQNQQYQAHMQQYGTQNADAIAQVQRQLEELRRQTQGGGEGWNGGAQQ